MGCCQSSAHVMVKEEMLGPSHCVVVSRPGEVTDYYTLEGGLGEGQFGSVRRGTHLTTGAMRAIKVVPKKNKLAPKGMRCGITEIEVMKALDHPNVVKLFETFEDKQTVHLVMELCEGGDLFGRICELGRFTEPQAALVCQQMLTAIRYVHGRNVCHRDLKPENLLFLRRGAIERNTLKLTDFGCSYAVAGPQTVMHAKVGTPYYVAPQVLDGKYTMACDLWSTGVIMYALLSGYPPFYAESQDEVLKKVKSGQYSFPRRTCGHMSRDSKDLIRELLEMDEEKRLSAAGALEHAWIKRTNPRATATATMPTNLVKNLRAFRSQSMLKKAALQVMAPQLNEAHIKELRTFFLALDCDGDGRLNAAEFAQAVQGQGQGVPEAEASHILDGVAGGGTGSVHYTDFLAAGLEKRLYLQEDLCWYAFNVLDKNGDGIISRDELEAVFKPRNSGAKSEKSSEETSIGDWISDADMNGDGGVDWSEFMDMLRSEPVEDQDDDGLSSPRPASPSKVVIEI